jgi:hypothetical protein
LIWSFIAPLVVAALAAWLLAECALQLGPRLMEVSPWHLVIGRKFVVLVIPIVLCVMMLASTLLTGLLTNIEQEEEREWWARAGGMLFSSLLCWLALNCVAFFATNSLQFMHASILAAVGLGAGYVGSAAGLSAATTSGLKRVKAEQLTKFETFLANHGLIAPVASGVALVCLALALATLTSWLRVKLYNRLIDTAKSLDPSVLQHYLFHYLGVTVHSMWQDHWVPVFGMAVHVARLTPSTGSSSIRSPPAWCSRRFASWRFSPTCSSTSTPFRCMACTACVWCAPTWAHRTSPVTPTPSPTSTALTTCMKPTCRAQPRRSTSSILR